MKILIAHNRYQQRGGEDSVIDAELNLLKSHGHEVDLYTVSNDDIKSFSDKLRTGLSVTYSAKSKEAFSAYLQSNKPDVVHFHNIFPLLTASVYESCQELNIPVIQTLHNYRNICPGALLMRDGKVCEKCVKGSAYQAVRYACYRGSYLQTLALSNMVASQKKNNTWHTKVNRFIALTEFAKNKFIEAGFPSNKISIKPNFIMHPKFESHAKREGFALFVGRLSVEKGVDILCDTFAKTQIPLKIVGDGPLHDELKNKVTNNVELLGNQPKEQVYELMSQAKCLIMPSVWYEGFPMVLVEAFAHALPVICSDIGGMAEVVKNEVHGLHFSVGDSESLLKKVQYFFEEPKLFDFMSTNTRETFLTEYSSEVNYQQLIELYQQEIDNYES